mgnify:CR=1 FL=1
MLKNVKCARCVKCGKEYEAVPNLTNCECGGILDIIYDYDYIKANLTKEKLKSRPNYNGYRSLHLDLRVPIYLSDRTESVLVEVQLRTVAMDFWASLEHDIRYKKDKAALPAGINEQMFACADEIADIDRKMQDMYHRIQAAE